MHAISREVDIDQREIVPAQASSSRGHRHSAKGVGCWRCVAARGGGQLAQEPWRRSAGCWQLGRGGSGARSGGSQRDGGQYASQPASGGCLMNG